MLKLVSLLLPQLLVLHLLHLLQLLRFKLKSLQQTHLVALFVHLILLQLLVDVLLLLNPLHLPFLHHRISLRLILLAFFSRGLLLLFKLLTFFNQKNNYEDVAAST